MTLTNAELMEDIQAETGESSAESVDLTAYLTDVESHTEPKEQNQCAEPS